MGTVINAIAIPSFWENSPFFTVQFRFIGATAYGAARSGSSLIPSRNPKHINGESKTLEVRELSMSESPEKYTTKV